MVHGASKRTENRTFSPFRNLNFTPQLPYHTRRQAEHRRACIDTARPRHFRRVGDALLPRLGCWMGAQRRGMVTHTDTTAVLGGETASLLDAPRAAPAEGDPFSRAFETGRGGGGYTIIEERTGGGPEGPPDLPLNGFQSYHAQPSSSIASSTHSREPPYPDRHRGATSSSSSKNRAKTRFPSLTPSLAPAPGNFSAAGDARAAEAVAHARKTWAPPALRTQAIASYGAVPDLEIIPENIEVDSFQRRRRVGGYSDLGCPACAIS